MPQKQFCNDGSWCWFQDPRAIRHVGTHDRTYFGWLSKEGHVEVAHHDHETGETEVTTVHEDFEADDHDAPTFLMDREGRVIVYYTKHGGPAIRWRRSTRPEDVSSFEAEQTIAPSNGHTYPMPVRLQEADDRIYLFYRNFADDKQVLAYVVSEDDGRTWSDEQILVTTSGYRDHGIVYPKIDTDGQSRVDIAMSHCDHRANSPHMDVYHVRFHADGVTDASGTPIAEPDDYPLELSSLPRIFDSRPNATDAWIWDCATHGDNPEVAFATFPDCADHSYHWARWDGSAWRETRVTDGGSYITRGNREKFYSGGIHLDHERPGTCYLSTGDHDGSKVQRWETDDDGVTWSVTDLTDATLQNVRPVVPRNRHPDLGVLWMQGSYTYFVRDYETAIVGAEAGAD